ncbi:BsuPI-related putative proteinase inhibitor [Halonatronum saccharophilum]|uniref:BsuPI-related putative proteinase inhibitor n=1 Tax=Halonatronum saccharophilum TaxID=150060 RepID=UPI0004B865C1|nr:BsuPI-related putative proteinase inhibitor [Halonatronum saccharophilum]
MLYRVRPGDTLFEIAQRFGVSVDLIVQLNRIEDPNLIEVGQTLLIPTDLPDIPGIPDRVEVRVQNFDYRVVDGLLIVFFTDKDVYSQGERIRLNIVKTNISNTDIQLSYATGQRVDFRAFREGERLWIWSAARVFSQVTRVVTLEPAQSQVFREIWDQSDDDGQQVPPGIYRITGWNVAGELRDDRLDVFIQIEG